MSTLLEVAIQLRFALSPRQLEAFDLYYRELIEARPRAGLTSLTDRESVERRHFVEPLVFLRAIEDAGAFNSPAIDVGSGGGFPGLPIKIVRPELQLTLLEASGRKVNFLQHLIQRLGLGGVSAVHWLSERSAK